MEGDVLLVKRFVRGNDQKSMDVVLHRMLFFLLDRIHGRLAGEILFHDGHLRVHFDKGLLQVD